MRRQPQLKRYRTELQLEYRKIYQIIGPRYKQLIPQSIRCRHNYQHLVVSDVTIIATTILGQLHGFSSQLKCHHWLTQTIFAQKPLIERSRYNRRCRDLTIIISYLRRAYVEQTAGDFSYLIIDSSPMPLCQPVRNLRATKLRDYADIGYNAAKRLHFYEFKLHCLLTNQGFIIDWRLSAASAHDSQVAGIF